MDRPIRFSFWVWTEVFLCRSLPTISENNLDFKTKLVQPHPMDGRQSRHHARLEFGNGGHDLPGPAVQQQQDLRACRF